MSSESCDRVSTLLLRELVLDGVFQLCGLHVHQLRTACILWNGRHTDRRNR